MDILIYVQYDTAASLNLSTEQSDGSDPFSIYFPIDFPSDPLEWRGWSPTGAVDFGNYDASNELDNGHDMASTSSALEKSSGEHSTSNFKDPPQTIIALGSLFGKIETLLNLCRDYVTIYHGILLTQSDR